MPIWACFASGFLFLGLTGVSHLLAIGGTNGIRGSSGLLAGRYRPDQCRVPLPALCACAGIELIQGEIVGIDQTQTLCHLLMDEFIQPNGYL